MRACVHADGRGGCPQHTCEIRADMDGIVDAAPRVALEVEAAVKAADFHLLTPPHPACLYRRRVW